MRSLLIVFHYQSTGSKYQFLGQVMITESSHYEVIYHIIKNIRDFSIEPKILAATEKLNQPFCAI